MKPLALVLPTLTGGGAERVTLNLAGYFADKLDRTVDLIVGRRIGEMAEDVPDGVQVVDCGVERTRQMIVPLGRYVRERKPCVVYSGTYYSTPIAAICKARQEEVAVVGEIENPVSIVSKEAQNIWGTMSGLACSAVQPWVDHWIAVSAGVKCDFCDNYRASESDVSVIGNPFEVDRIRQLSREKVVHKWYEDGRGIKVIAVGRLVRQKNFSLLLKAIAHLKNKGHSVELLLLGKGARRRRLETLAVKLDIQEEIHLAGYTKNPYRFMRAADCLVVSSLWEGFGNVIVEALAVDTPVVSTRCPFGPEEILEGGRWGKLTPPDCSAELAKGIVDVVGSDQYENRYLPARAQEFQLERVGERYLSVFRELV